MNERVHGKERDVNKMIAGLALMASLPLWAKSVTLADVTRGDAGASLWISGTVASRQQAELSAEQSGRVAWIADFGSRVEAGQVLLRLDSIALHLSLEQARAEQARWASSLRFARAEFERQDKLRRQHNASLSQFDKARLEMEQAELALQLAEIAARQIEDQIRRSQIHAPFAGVVNHHFIQPGEHVDAGEKALALVNPDAPDIRLQAPIDWALRLAPDTLLKVEGAGLQGEANYYQRAASADPVSRLIELRLKPRKGSYIIGAPVRVALPLGERQAMLLPRDALVLNTEGSVVFRVKGEGDALTVSRVPVTILFGDERQVAISGALTPGDRVVVRGAGALSDGDKVELYRGS